MSVFPPLAHIGLALLTSSVCDGMPWCYAARHGLVRLVGRLPVGMRALSDTAALRDRGTSVLQRSCSASDEG